jgi:hypothetical protein
LCEPRQGHCRGSDVTTDHHNPLTMLCAAANSLSLI